MASETQDWEFGMFSCAQPCKCILGLIAPCCAAACARGQFDKSNFLFNCCCVGPVAIYNFIREGYKLKGSCTEDVICMTCCTCFAIARMWAEAESRGKITAQAGAITTKDWDAGLFVCRDFYVFIYACCYPTCAIASARTAYDESDAFFNCSCMTPCAISNLIREGYGIDGNWLCDLLFMCICQPCQIQRVFMEVKNRGPVHNQRMK